MHVQSILIPLLHFVIQLLKQVGSLLRDRNPQIRDSVAPIVHELAFLWHILILVLDEVREVRPFKVDVFGLLRKLPADPLARPQ
jgi:hypothetical protein